MLTRLALPTCLVFALSAPVSAADIALTRAVVVTPPNIAGSAVTAVRMLAEEVEVRSMARWERAEQWPAAEPRWSWSGRPTGSASCSTSTADR
jgi:hypothetical protein